MSPHPARGVVFSPDPDRGFEVRAALAPGASTLLRFRAHEGAGGHCEPLARAVVAERIFDWLDDRIAT